MAKLAAEEAGKVRLEDLRCSIGNMDFSSKKYWHLLSMKAMHH